MWQWLRRRCQALKKVEDTLEECGLGSKIGAAGKGVQAGVTREFDEEGLMFSGGRKAKAGIFQMRIL